MCSPCSMLHSSHIIGFHQLGDCSCLSYIVSTLKKLDPLGGTSGISLVLLVNHCQHLCFRDFVVQGFALLVLLKIKRCPHAFASLAIDSLKLSLLDEAVVVVIKLCEQIFNNSPLGLMRGIAQEFEVLHRCLIRLGLLSSI